MVGLVFTQIMRDEDIIEAALALCAMRNEHDGKAALEQGTAMLRVLDWRAPANTAMLRHILSATDPALCSEAASGYRSLDQILPPRPQIGGGGSAADVDAAMAAFLETPEGKQFIGTIREFESASPDVFTAAMTDGELVRWARGICATQSELGPGAAEELRLTQESYGWTSDADDAMFAVLVEESAAVCITVGS